MIEVKIKPHDAENAGSPERLKAILHAAGIPVGLDNSPVIRVTEPGTLHVEASHEGTLYQWVPAPDVEVTLVPA